MARIVLPFDEALELVRGVQPLPRQLRDARGQGDTILLRLNPEGLLPGFLRAFSADINLVLRFRSYSSGVAVFDLETRLFSLPATSLINIVLRLVSHVGARGVRLEAPKTAGSTPKLSITVQALLDEHVGGVTLEDLAFEDGAFVAVVKIADFVLRRPAPSPPPEERA